MLTTLKNEFTPFNFDVVDFVTSDHHFGHARIIELARRPFASVDDMNRVMIERWNETVAPDDVVLHLGDLALGRIEASIHLTRELNGIKLLVPGNHDRVSTATQTGRAIERFSHMYADAGWSILPEVLDGLRRGRRLRASHFPYKGDSQLADRHIAARPIDDGVPLIHGHTHDEEQFSSPAEFHVGVDASAFTPISLSVIDRWLDEDTHHRTT